MLIKKTIVLSNGIDVVGHATVIRIGNASGIKITMDTANKGMFYIGLKIGNKPQQNLVIEGKKEYELSVNPEHGDALGIVILNEKGEVIATGGRKESVNRTTILPRKAEPVEEVVIEDDNSVILENEDTKPAIEVSETIESEEYVAEDKMDEEPREEVVCTPENNFGDCLKAFSYNRGEHFYQSIRARLEEIMTINPREEKLEALIPDSKWVKVYYDKGEYYVVGVLSEDGVVKFLAYGVPGVKGVKPPKEAEELCDFVTLSNGIGEGYWLMFQNAQNGEIVKSI